MKAASDAGADSIDMCDTNGGCLPHELGELVDQTVVAFPGQQFGIHCHNDTGCAVANARCV